LAGSISTGTHGGEFQWPLLTDRVRAIHLVGPGGVQWWIEGSESVADQTSLQKTYPALDATHFIGGNWQGISGLASQDVLNAVIVSMGTMGIIYSVVLEVVPRFGIEEVVTFTSWSNLLAIAGVSVAQLQSGDTAANQRVLSALLDGTMNGTGIAAADNVYADLAINPFTQEAWITNRQVTSKIPIDSTAPVGTIPDYLSSVSAALSRHAQDSVEKNFTLGRVFDFLNYATDVPSVNISDDINDFNQAINLFQYVTSFPDVLTSALATISAQAVANIKNEPSKTDRGFQFLGDLLTARHSAVLFLGWPLSGNIKRRQYTLQQFLRR
jgi:hypothetical protein